MFIKPLNWEIDLNYINNYINNKHMFEKDIIKGGLLLNQEYLNKTLGKRKL
jgi:hypothetical protein